MCLSLEMVMERRSYNKCKTRQIGMINFKKQHIHVQKQTHKNSLYYFLLNQTLPSCVRQILADDDDDDDEDDDAHKTNSALELEVAHVLLSLPNYVPH